jgi:hypothetical protein
MIRETQGFLVRENEQRHVTEDTANTVCVRLLVIRIEQLRADSLS